MQNIITEIRITENSPFAHTSVKDIEEQFNVEIKTISNPFPSPAENRVPSPGFKLYPSMYVEIGGSYEDIKNLRLHAVDT